MMELLRTRRSIRRYSDNPIDRKTVSLLIESALRAPSSRDIKPWEFIIVDNAKLLSELAESKEHGSQFLRGATLGIVVCADSGKSDVWIEDCSIASILVQMMAHSLGLGSCWIQIRNRKHKNNRTAGQYVQKILGLPRHVKVESIISIGYPAQKKKPIAKSSLNYEKIHHNNYSMQYCLKRK
ncbi:MAG TPA: nitroreductase family protein [Dissulfurispiraceae bacterium]|nr:nitroreductase family protein [Dissulfurispiraceae bacterium]